MHTHASSIWKTVCSALVCVVYGLLGACVVAPRVQTLPAMSAPQPARLEQDVAVLPDGATLPLRSWLPAGAPTAVILGVHGLDDHAGSFATTGLLLAAQGFAVYAFDQRGFGRTAQRGIWAGSDLLADDVHEVARLLRLRYPGVRLYALGESMGSAVVLHALHRHSTADWIDGAALLAPAVWSRALMPWYARMPLRVLSHSWRGMKLSGRSTGRAPTDDAQALQQLRDDPLVIHRARVDVLWGVADLMDAVTAEPVPTAVPLLILSGGRDEIVAPQATCAWLRTLRPNGESQLAFYPDGWHLLTRDSIASTVHDDLAAWFTRPGSRVPSGATDGMPVERLCVNAEEK